MSHKVKYAIALLLTCCTLYSGMSAQTPDTVVVELASSSKLVLTIGDREDIDILRRYDFQALFDDIFTRLRAGDTLYQPAEMDRSQQAIEVDEGDDDDQSMDLEPADAMVAETQGYRTKSRYTGCCKQHHRTRHAFNFDVGINNVIGEGGRFPDVDDAPYSVRPWGSWYIGINSVLRTDISHAFYIESSVGVSWYNFKFQDERIQVTEDAGGVIFIQDPRDLDFQKSKLSATFLNASLVPMIRLGHHHRHHHNRFWNSGGGFRIGIGPYVGYRLESHTRQVYEIDGENHDDKEWDNFYLNNLRYGLRLQMGVGDADFFINYDLNELFADDRGPRLNAFAFGLIF